MKILIVGLVKNSQIVRLQEEGEKRGHKVEGCYTNELVIETGSDFFNPTLRGKSLKNYDLIYLWSAGKRRWEWYTACLYLWEKFGSIIINKKCISPEYNFYLTPAIDYYLQVKNKLPFPRSAIIFSTKSIDSVIKDFNFPLILKTSGGRQGKGVFKIEDKDALKNKSDELFKVSPSLVIREFIPNDGDIRIFTVGYKTIAAMKRIPTQKGEFRSNISQGGRGENFNLDDYPKIRDIAEKASKIMETEIAGVDIIIDKKTRMPYILEINPGPQFTGLEKYTKVNAAKKIIEYFEEVKHAIIP